MTTAKLTVTGMGPTAQVISLEKEMIIGRSIRADIQVDGDLVSRQHARVFDQDGVWHFEDLGSRNGTLLNGVRTASAELQTGDVIMIGYGKVLFEKEEDIGAAPEFAVSFIDNPNTVEAAVFSAAVGEDEADGAQATMALSYKDLILLNQRIATITRISQKLATILDKAELLDEVMSTLFELFPQAQRGCTVLRDEFSGFRVQNTKQRASGAATASVMKISTKLIDTVRRERKSVLSADTAQDDRFSGRESIIGAAGRSIMCAPLQHEKEFFGVVYLDTESLMQPFTPTDLNLMQGIAGPVAVFLKNAELINRMEDETRMRTSLSRYLSPDLVAQISDGSLSANLGGDQAEGTVMFSDIVGFTAMSERMTATEVLERLNRYFTSMLEAIFGWDGTVDKFGGDAVLAVWGAPMPNPEHAMMGTAGALEMQARLFVLNLALEAAGETTIKMAVGLNSGHFVAGNIGGQDRVEWTVIGDNVNLAQRVESQGFRGCVLVSESTYEQIAEKKGAYGFPPVSVKGKSEPVKIYSIRTLETPRGITAAIPAVMQADADELRSIIVKVVNQGGRLRLTLRCGGEPSIGATVELRIELPEMRDPFGLRGRVTSSSPLLESPVGRSVDMDVDWADQGLISLLTAGGASGAQVTLGEIER